MLPELRKSLGPLWSFGSCERGLLRRPTDHGFLTKLGVRARADSKCGVHVGVHQVSSKQVGQGSGRGRVITQYVMSTRLADVNHD